MARLTLARTPSSLLSLRSIRAEHDAQVMPVMARSTWRVDGLAPWPGWSVEGVSAAFVRVLMWCLLSLVRWGARARAGRSGVRAARGGQAATV